MYYIMKKAEFFLSLKISAQSIQTNQSFNQSLLFSSLFLSLHFYSQTHPWISAASLWIATLVVLINRTQKIVIQLSGTSRLSLISGQVIFHSHLPDG